MDKYSVGSKISVSVVMQKIYEYCDYSFSFNGSVRYIYSMKDDDGNIYVWKTSSFMIYDSGKTDSWGDPIPAAVRKGDRIFIRASVKGYSEYKGQEQILIQRVKFEMIEAVPTKEELDARRREEQIKSLSGNDFVWEMPYSQYKQHYSDCEVLAGSFIEALRDIPARISVIIREGRLKPSGVRGQHFSGYGFKSADGTYAVYRAVSEENALRRCQKEFPDKEWELFRVYR